jgi:PelA/Pel-15E family pectate lyase
MRLPLFAALALLTIPAHAAVVGTNPPSQPVTLARIATLPVSEQAAWRAYLERSTRLQAADRASLAAERKGMNPAEVRLPPHGRTGSVMPLNRPAAWYASADAQRRADNLITFQLPSGGWSKNFDPVDHPRARGEGYSPENTSKFLTPGDNDQPQDIHWSYLGTFDNDATTTELHFLAKAIHAADATRSKAWRAAFDRGLDYILAAQFPHGGWPQVYPLEGGYHDAITYNDDAMTNLLTFLQDIADGREAFAFVAADQRVRAAKAIQRGLDCLLATQIRVGSRRTGWGQQHDALTREPVSARNYEMPSQASSESAGTVLYLMAQTNPSPAIVAAVHAAVAWFKQTQINGMAFRPAPDGSGRKLLPAPDAGPIWARYYEIGRDRPLFGDRDKSIHDDVAEISQERRNGYSWYGNRPIRVLEAYAAWAKDHPRPND